MQYTLQHRGADKEAEQFSRLQVQFSSVWSGKHTYTSSVGKDKKVGDTMKAEHEQVCVVSQYNTFN